jgi:hypothetical protein
MTEIDYKNLAEYQRYENLVNTKDFVYEKDYKFIIGYDPLEKENWVKESWHYEEGEHYLNLKLYYQKLKK